MATRKSYLTPRMGLTREQIVEEVARIDPRGAAWHRQHAAECPDEWPVIVTELITYFENPDTLVIDGVKHYRAGWISVDWESVEPTWERGE